MHFHWLKHGWKQQAPIFHLSDLESDAQPLAVGPVAKWIRRWFGKPSMASRSLAEVKFRRARVRGRLRVEYSKCRGLDGDRPSSHNTKYHALRPAKSTDREEHISAKLHTQNEERSALASRRLLFDSSIP